MIARVKSNFLRRSGVRNALRKAESKIFLLRMAAAEGFRRQAVLGVRRRVVTGVELCRRPPPRSLALARSSARFYVGRPPPRSLALARSSAAHVVRSQTLTACRTFGQSGMGRVAAHTRFTWLAHAEPTRGLWRPTGPREPVGRHSPHVETPFLQLDGAATSGGDLVLGGGAERMRRHLELHAPQVAVAQHLDQPALADRAGLDELVRPDRAPRGEQLGEPVQVHDLVLDPEVVLEPLQLGQAHVDRHLPTLERRRDVLARLGALRAPTGRLALRAFAPA